MSAVTHTLLAVWAVGLLTGGGGGDSQGWTRPLMTSEWGQLILGLVGIAVAVAGFAHIYKGVTARFERYVDFPPDARPWASPVCRFGLIAWFFIDTAYGPWLLGIVAPGLFAFGVYSLLEAFYRRVNVSFDLSW